MKLDVPEELISLIQSANRILVLTGAGISAESGIPTFRGKEGYWVVGSRNYYPEEMATHRFFRENPEELLKWYEHRQNICLQSKPNEGHKAITQLEQWAETSKKDFLLITQNVDNLHHRAGTKNIIEIHGNIFRFRCSNDFTADGHNQDLVNINDLSDIPVTCSKCNSLLRPHVLWFDEYYTEELFKAESALAFALKADLLVVVGTTLATTIPNRIVSILLSSDKPVIEVNPDPVLDNYTEFVFNQSSSEVLPKLIESLT
ncbi:MAG: SIR2 family NAD-dependent protein deacylase [Candidatus Kariarchaeaceae archaeon]